MAEEMLSGACHCGACGWTFAGPPGLATACNCTQCRRYGALWIHGPADEAVRFFGPTAAYRRADEPTPALEVLFCPTCGGAVGVRGLIEDAAGRRRCAVNVRHADPETVAALPIRRFDGLDTFEALPGETRCVRDLWF